jgi:(S)-ureidoglycine-glyoxylate aminotransferase
MPVADLNVPSRLLAGGGPSSPDPRVLRALASPLIGQFDPAFTRIMDEVMQLARLTFLTHNVRCFPVSGLAEAGLEAVLNTLVEEGDHVAIDGGPRFVAETAAMATRYGARVEPVDALGKQTAKLLVVPLVDPTLGRTFPVHNLANACHKFGTQLVVDATQGLAACELHVDSWGIDVCVAGVDYAVGAPSGMALVTYTPSAEALMHARKSPPRTSYLDLLQLQAYWSAERLNHHTAPTSLVYGLREALRLVVAEEHPERWARHRRVGCALRAGLEALGLEVSGDPPYAIVRLPARVDEAAARRNLLQQFAVHVRLIASGTWCVGLLGADARLDAVLRVVGAVEQVLDQRGAVSAALDAYGRA